MATSSEPQDSPRVARSKPGSVAVLAKAMAILDRLAEEGETTPAHLSELIDEPRSTVYRLLASLQDLEYIEPGSRRGTYRLGLKLFRLGSTVVSRYDERQAALPVMERLHEATGESIFLCVRRGLQAVCIERIDGARVTLLELRLGGALPLHLGAAPRALLAFEPEDVWEQYLADAHPEPRAPNTPLTLEAIVEGLRATRDRGFAVSDQDVTLGVAAIGAPIFGHTGKVRASLSVGGLRDIILGDGSHVSELVVSGAREISHALGYRE